MIQLITMALSLDDIDKIVSARSPAGTPTKPTSLNLATNENNGHSRSPNGISLTYTYLYSIVKLVL